MIRTNPEIILEIDQPAPEPESIVTVQETTPTTEPRRRGRKPQTCKSCGLPGHRQATCPNGSNGSKGFLNGKAKERVQELKEEGYDSNQIADELGIPLTVVHKYW